MYAVSAEYISAMQKGIQRHKFSGTISGTPFRMEHVLQNSLTISDQCSDSADLSLGGVFIGTLKFTLLNNLGFARGSWKGREVVLKFSMLVDETNDIWESIPVGVFDIAEVNHSEKGIEITAYTRMAKLNTPYDGTSTTGNVFDILTLACSKCKVELANTKTEIENLPNGNIVLGLYPENNCSTWRDVAHYAAQVVGGFLTADRQGRIALRHFGNTTDFEIDTTRRLTGSKFSDFLTNYTEVRVDKLTDGTVRSRSIRPNEGISINLGNNPLLQYGTDDTVNGMLDNILSIVNSIAYVPFNSSMVGNPAFDLGDLITYVGGTAGEESICCLMSYTWKFNHSYSVKGFGKDPNLANTMSKAEKASGGGAGGSSKADTVSYISYVNAKELIVDNIEKLIADININNYRETFIDFWIELKMTVEVEYDAAVLKFRYSMDGESELYRPVTTINHSGVYTMNFHYYWKLRQVLLHELKVFLEVEGGTVRIDRADLNALITGQGLVGDKEFDGKLEAEDIYIPVESGYVAELADEGHIIFVSPIRIGNYEDSYTPVSTGAVAQLADSADIKFSAPIYTRITEDNFDRITEDGLDRITE